MRKKKLVTIVGARPQFIKAAVLSRSLKRIGVDEIMIHTGQHYDFFMSDIFFSDLKIPKPAYHLGIGSANHGEQTGRMLTKIEAIIMREKPDLAVVFGDTNSTLAGALAAAKLHVPLAHVEAGLRSYDRDMPEEINRLLSDHLSTLLFCPTANAVRNLSREGIRSPGRHGCREVAKKRPRKGTHEPLVVNSGDVMYDLALETAEKMDRRTVLQKFRLPEKGFILATIHRAENTDQPEKLGSIIQALNDLAAQGMPVFFPMHPRTRNVFKVQGLRRYARHPRFEIHGPVTYPEMIALEAEARLIITDSGGVQKEGYFFRTPCLIPRWKSEWPELLASGWNVLCGSERRNVFAQAMILCNFPGRRRWKNYFGQGQAADTIARTIKSY